MQNLRLVFILFFILSYTSMNAQMMYLTYGYNGTFPNLSGINNVVDNYNETRPWLNSQMDHFNYLDGFSVNMGFGISSMWMELGYDFRSQVKSANGTDSFGNRTRELKIRNSSPQFTLGLLANVIDRGAIGIGCRLDLGSIKAKTRVFESTSDKGKFEEISGVRYSGTRIGPTLKILTNRGNSGFLLTGSIFYLWNISATDQNAWDLDEKLNGTEYFGDYPSKFAQKSNNFGFTLAIGMAGSGG